MLNQKTNANKAGAIGLVSEKYNHQIRSAANMKSQSAAASDLIGRKESYSQWNRRIHFYVTDTDDCNTDLRFSRHFWSEIFPALNNIFVYLRINTEVLL